MIWLFAALAACSGSTATRPDGAPLGDAAVAARPDGAPVADAAVATPADAAPCGDAAVAARFPPCMQTHDQASCEQAGGTWGLIGLSHDPACQCPTGQGGCPCLAHADCLSDCIAPIGPGGIFDCAGVHAGTCSPVGDTVGCWCWLGSGGQVTPICKD